MYFLSGPDDGSQDIDAYTGGLAELPVHGGLVRDDPQDKSSFL